MISVLGGHQVGLGKIHGRLGFGNLGVGRLDSRLGCMLGGQRGHVLVLVLIDEPLLDGVAPGQFGDPVERLLAIVPGSHGFLEHRNRLLLLGLGCLHTGLRRLDPRLGLRGHGL